MGTYNSIELKTSSNKHRRTNVYFVVFPADARQQLTDYVTQQTNEKWLVNELGLTRDEVAMKADVTYGPVTGNYPSDVQRLFRDAEVELLNTPKRTQSTHHLAECKHPKCVAMKAVDGTVEIEVNDSDVDDFTYEG